MDSTVLSQPTWKSTTPADAAVDGDNAVRGTRLTDLALTNIEMIDRNLYERACDVLWWATDSSVIAALTDRTPESYRLCAKRLGLILNSYTSYFDLVLCDENGAVVANGRPAQYESIGKDCGGSGWFRSAAATASGETFGFEGVHESELVGGRRVLVYSCGVREKGIANARLIGVLGILFNWDALAQQIVYNTPLGSAEKSRTRVCILDDDKRILADSDDRQLIETLDFAGLTDLMNEPKSFAEVVYCGRTCCAGHAASPGYETYATGWHSVILQDLETI